MPVDTVELSLSGGDRKTFRAFAQQNKSDLAGSLQLEWTSTNPLVAEVQSTTDGVATVVPRSAGSAMLVATGGTFTQQVPIKVQAVKRRASGRSRRAWRARWRSPAAAPTTTTPRSAT